MPELPEMEIYKHLLSDQVIGKIITDVKVTRPKSINIDVDSFIKDLQGRQVLFIERRAKYLLFHLDNGRRLLLHLMLGGSMFYGTPEEKPDRTVQVELTFGTHALYFIGLRLGFLHYLSAKDADNVLDELGPEPLDRRMTLEKFKSLCNKKRGTLKTTLLQQNFIAGIGNCYSDEIAFAASILPSVKMQDLSDEMIERLYNGMQSILSEAIASGGYTETPFTVSDTLSGGYNARMRVYDREGESCYRCGHVIERTELASRKVFHCTGCQHEQ